MRVRDILSELEGRIEPLRKQADKAQTFLKLSEQKKTMDISLAVWQFDSFRDGLRQLDNQLCIAKEASSAVGTASGGVGDCNPGKL